MASFNTYDYDFLLKSLSEGSLVFKVEASKRLITLAGSDKRQFTAYSRAVLAELEPMYRQDKQDLNFHATQLFAEIVSNALSRDNEQLARKQLASVIVNLGHGSKTHLRKACHTCLLAYLKTYHNFDALQEAYLLGIQHENPLVQQKSINSFQSILILELKLYDFTSSTSARLFASLLEQLAHQNPQVVKAATQCILSMAKIDTLNLLLAKLTKKSLEVLLAFMQDATSKMGDDTFAISPEKITLMIDFFQQLHVSQVEPKPQPQEEYARESHTPKNVVTQRRLEKIRNSMKLEEKKDKQDSKQARREPPQAKLFSLAGMDGSLKQRTQAVEELLYKIHTSKNKPEYDSSVKAILPSTLKLLKDGNPKIVNVTLRIVEHIVEHLANHPSNSGALNSLIAGVVEKLGDPKISIRQNVSKIVRELVTRTSRSIWVRELLENMKRSTNTALKEETLSLLHFIYESSSQDIEYPTIDILDQISAFTEDPKTKIKIKTLDCLAVIVFKSNEREKFSSLLKSKMNAIFYQMYQEKLANMQSEEDKAKEEQERKKKDKQEVQQENYHHRSQEQRQKVNLSDKEEDPLNVSLEMVKKRVSLLRKPRNLLSTQETISVDHSHHTDQSTHRTLEEVQIMLPSLYKKTTTNRFIAKRPDFTPNRTIDKVSDYLSKEDLKPLRDPEREIKSIMCELKSGDWKVQFETTNKLRRLIEFNPEVLLEAQQGSIHSLNIDLLALIENLRSSVSKNALICLNEFIVLLGRQLDVEVESLLEKLIKKSADTNVFISAEVQRCLTAVATNCTAGKVLDKISLYRESKSIPIKDAIVSTMATMKHDKDAHKLAESLAFFLVEAQIQIRNKAKAGLLDLCKSFGDWYRALRGKINPVCFKSICELMTKSNQFKKQETLDLKNQNLARSPNFKREDHPSRRQSLGGQPQETAREPETRKQTIRRGQAAEVPPARKRLTKVSQFPVEFNEIQGWLEQSNSSDWKKRIESLSRIREVAIEYPNEFIQFRSATHFVDVLCRQMLEPNIKVSMHSLDTLVSIFEPLKILLENNLGIISNSVFTGLSSSKTEIKDACEKSTALLIDQIDIPSMLQHLCHGILYSLPRSRIYLLCKLSDKLETIHELRKQLLFKHIFPLLNKLMDEYRTELMPTLVSLFCRLYELMGKEMFSHLTKFKEVRDLIGK